jgi:hypothetical protein
MSETSRLGATEATTEPEGQADNGAASLEQTAQEQQQSSEGQGGDSQATETEAGEQTTDKGGEQKAEGEKGGDSKGEDEASEPYELKAPEGVEVDSSVLETVAEVARELDLPKDKIQKVVDKAFAKAQDRAAENYKATVAEWGKESRKLPELVGGDGFDANLKIANSAIDKFGNDALMQLLDGGLGNHPAFVAFAYKVGKALQPDGFVAGGRTESAGTPAPNDDAAMARRLYKEQ